MTEEILEQQTGELEEYYYDELDSDLKELDNKAFTNRTKAIELLLKAKTQAEQLALDSKKLDFEIESAKQAAAVEAEKLELEKQKVEIAKQQAEDELKKSKKEFWLNVAKVGVGVAGAAASIGLTVWATVTTMKFEETGSLRTAAGKLAQGIAKGACSKLDKLNNT